jgi:hypothetical protein
VIYKGRLTGNPFASSAPIVVTSFNEARRPWQPLHKIPHVLGSPPPVKFLGGPSETVQRRVVCWALDLSKPSLVTRADQIGWMRSLATLRADNRTSANPALHM